MDTPSVDSAQDFETLLNAVFKVEDEDNAFGDSRELDAFGDSATSPPLRDPVGDNVTRVMQDLSNIDPCDTHAYITNEDLRIIQDNIDHFSDELLEKIPNVYSRGESKLTYARESLVIIKAIAAGVATPERSNASRGGFSLRMLLHAGRVLIQPTHNCYGKNSTKNGSGTHCTKTRRLGCFTCASHKSTFMSPRAYMSAAQGAQASHTN